MSLCLLICWPGNRFWLQYPAFVPPHDCQGIPTYVNTTTPLLLEAGDVATGSVIRFFWLSIWFLLICLVGLVVIMAVRIMLRLARRRPSDNAQSSTVNSPDPDTDPWTAAAKRMNVSKPGKSPDDSDEPSSPPRR